MGQGGATPLAHLAGSIWERPFKSFNDYMIKGGRKGLQPEQVGEVVLTALTAAKPKVRYTAVQGDLQNSTPPSLLPRRMLGRRLGLSPKPAA